MTKKILKSYAELVAKVGVNVQKNQEVIINASVDQVEFVSLVVEECYKCGAKSVTVDWATPPSILKNIVKYETVETLAEVPNWKIEKIKHQVNTLPARIHIMSSAPDAMKGIDQAKLAKSRMMSYPIIKPFQDELNNKYQWTIVAVPSVEWAKKVFPVLPRKAAVDSLWEAILTTARVTSDPIKAWDLHNKNLLERCNYLNSLNIDYLEYKSSNGTNLKVGLMEQSLWCGGGETTLGGVYFNPNMPTEECFTSPKKGVAEGKVVATKPLSYNGELIENFYFVFKEGKVVECHAERGVELLKQMVSMDDGAAYLGECALVPFESPVNKTGILFYNTLFDENAVCHFAIGRGFTDCIKDFSKYTNKEMEEMGLNQSMIHVDFMIGSSDLSIDAYTKDGKKVSIFKDGTWNF